MHNNHHFLKALAPELNAVLKNTKLKGIFSNRKEEITFCCESPLKDKSHYISISFYPDFSTIYIPSEFHPSHQAHVCFKELEGLRVHQVKVYKNERAIGIDFSNGYHLVLKMFGNRSNILLFQGDAVIDIFNKKLVIDKQAKKSDFEKVDPILTAELFEWDKLKNIVPTLGDVIIRAFEQLNLHLKTKEEQLISISNFINTIPTKFYVTKNDRSIAELSLFNTENAMEFTSAIEALNEFYRASIGNYIFSSQKNALIRRIETKLRKHKKLVEHLSTALIKIQEDRAPDEIANIVMANLHLAKPHVYEYRFDDFYNEGQTIKITIPANLTFHKYAEKLYGKTRNRKLEIERLKTNIASKEELSKALEQDLFQVTDTQEYKTLKTFLKKYPEDQSTIQQQVAEEKFKRFDYQGFVILVGRNSKNNDELTLKEAKKDDLWLHARDVSGSHVIIRQQAGKPFPKNVIEYAASLAAYYSKRKTDSLCPVIVTPKKYVRKRKGAAHGAVIVEREEVVMVKPATM